MQFLLMIYADETAMASATPDDMAQMMNAHREFSRMVPELGGTILGGEALEDSPTASTVRDGVITDGPFLESKEALGGYYLIDVPSREVALEIARHCPVSMGGVEVRGVWDTSNL